MPIVRFDGRVSPEASKLTIDNHPELRWQDDGSNYWMTFRITIKDSHVQVSCEVEDFRLSEHLVPIYVRALDISQASVNLAAFSLGLGVSVIFDTWTDPEGTTQPFVMRDRPLASLCTSFELGAQSFEEVWDIVLKEPLLYRALRDLIASITNTHEIPASCGRAVETLRVLIAPQEPNRKKAWKHLQTQLRVTENFTKIISDNSIGPRHGDHHYVPGTATREIATKAWVLMDRFLEYRKRGNQALLDMPLLDS